MELYSPISHTHFRKPSVKQTDEGSQISKFIQKRGKKKTK
jgi:hypothetical protein